MALDKLVDSAQLDTDLTSVANAIRTKGGTSSQLSFPNGMVTAIQNLPSGSSVTVESITLYSNGTTTAPSGKAYSPITVAIPVYDGTLQ